MGSAMDASWADLVPDFLLATAVLAAAAVIVLTAAAYRKSRDNDKWP